ncbi:hypothetical protein I5J98_21265, partial [Pseudomonas aeruginosa]|nr:hypothetical protein [Pseudomonas aeruginosa]
GHPPPGPRPSRRGRGPRPGSWLELLVRTLRLDTGVRVELSGKHAQEWRDALRGQGVLNSRMELGQSEVEGLHLNWLR